MIIHEPFPYFLYEDFFENNLLTSIYEKYKSYNHSDRWITADEHELNAELQSIAYKKIFPIKKILDPYVTAPRNKYPCNINDSFFKIMIKVMDPGTSYDVIHTDAAWKQLTTLVYVSKQGTGTRLYKSDKEESFAKEVEWKQNRGFSFIPSNNSWHNFLHDPSASEKRIVVMFTLSNKTYYR